MNGSRILVVDDSPAGLRLMRDRLGHAGYDARGVVAGLQALDMAREWLPDLVLLDVMMPGMDGFETCRQLRMVPGMEAVPIVMLTALDASDERVRGLNVGADDFVSKPVETAELMARVRAQLRAKRLYDTVVRQREELANWAATLEDRVQQALKRERRLSRLKLFFSPSLAQRLVAEGTDDPLRSHRREVTVLFADLRGFTAFSELAPADEVMAMLARFHQTLGGLIFAADGTLERFTGDGMMVFFNDPDPQPDHVWRAVQLGLAMQRAAVPLLQAWANLGPGLGLAVGISVGTATLGPIGTEARMDYAAIGSVTNRAARLCAEADAGQVICCDGVFHTVADLVPGAVAVSMHLKGFAEPVQAHVLQTMNMAAHPPDPGACAV